MDRPHPHAHSHGHGNASPVTTNSPQQATRRVSTALADDDRGLTMRERERDRGDDNRGSVGKVGGVGVGVTKPKRRLSSLPNLLQPFFPGAPSYRAMSTTSTTSPPTSPKGLPPHSTYQNLQNHSNHVTSSGNHYQTTYNRSNPPRLDDKIGMVSYATAMAAASRERDGPPMLWGIELKWISLITLALQNAFLTIIMHYSRISTSPNKTYSAASAVLLNELLKGSISVVIALKRIDNEMSSSSPPPVYYEKNDSKISDRRSAYKLPSLLHSTRLSALSKALFSPDCYKLSVPAILYVIQNNLQYVAASNLDVATFQVTYQMKILTTAFFSVILLRKRLSRAKWASLIMLAIGVGIVQIQSSSAPAASTPSAPITANHGEHQLRSEIPEETMINAERVMHPLRGFLAVTLACLTSGLAGVYFEFILKSSSGSSPPPDLWIRNTQLSLFSLIPAIVPIVVSPSGPAGVGYVGRIMSSFSNFNGWAIGTVLTQTFGGLITALVIRYSDNIMKGFATSLSIIISFLASVALFSYPITVSFVVGASIVLAATYLYNSPSLPDGSQTRTAVAVAPGSPISQTAPILGEPDQPSRTSSVINLLGLGSSNANSRKPSATDLRSHFGAGLTPATGLGSGYSASAPGTPRLGGGYSDVNGSGRSSPGVAYANRMGGGPGTGLGAGGPGTGFGRDLNSGREKSKPVLTLDINNKS
ncbi:hypothetical protein IAR55_001849 [Kwoniella newhampshirensis]|uniref:Solute carrier family 35 (UDP-sugar transporter), member A1/2/3 n=1 Tax=Kwoniella newhampshirensis TaxID=1651941 RepID=A0AAW0Z3K9_9TREE